MIELEGITGVEIKAEEEPKGKTLMGSGGEALRPPGMNIINFPDKLSLFGCIWTAAPFYSLYIGSSLVTR